MRIQNKTLTSWIAGWAQAAFILFFGVMTAQATDWRQVYDSEFKKLGDKYYQNPDSLNLAWYEMYVMDSLLTMYETYKDRRYLDTFATHADAVVAEMSDDDGDGYSGWGSYTYGNEKIPNGAFDKI